MFPPGPGYSHRGYCFPRIRGDVPSMRIPKRRNFKFSPHTRGCSQGSPHRYSHDVVFPAYAGMFRRVPATASLEVRFPRIRGDVPISSNSLIFIILFSPHTRGCSRKTHAHHRRPLVFPAYAGMFLISSSLLGTPLGFPRIRGDVPTHPIARS